MNDDISLSEALEIINLNDKAGNPYPFNIAVRTLNKQSKKGGKLNIYKGAKRLAPKSVKRLTAKYLHLPDKEKRDPNHVKNRTRNIELPNGQKKKIHIRLIVSINDKKVVY